MHEDVPENKQNQHEEASESAKNGATSEGAGTDNVARQSSTTSLRRNSTALDHKIEETFHDAAATQDATIPAARATTPRPDLPPLHTNDNTESTEAEPQTPLTNREGPISPTSPISKDLVEQLIQSPTQTHRSKKSVSLPFSESSHQQLVAQTEETVEEDDEGEWQAMPALATHTVYDDWGKVVAKSYDDVEDESYGYGGLGGAGKGYTKVHLDDDVASQTSFDDNTAYLFKEGYARNALDEDDETRDMVSQMQTTKELLTEGQRIAYVGIVRLSMIRMLEQLDAIERTKAAKKSVDFASESMRLWSQKMMVRLYSHMDISSQEQIMVEQLSEHGVLPEDMTPTLMQHARVKNPKPGQIEEQDTPAEIMATDEQQPSADRKAEEAAVPASSDDVATDDTTTSRTTSASPSHATNVEMSTSETTPSNDVSDDHISKTKSPSHTNNRNEAITNHDDEDTIEIASPPAISAQRHTSEHSTPPPEYEQTKADGLHIERPEDLPDTKDIDLDIRWTVLCDLFLMLIADGQYDSRSRLLLERVGKSLAIDWPEICRFERRITDALEMQEQAGKETWDEGENLEARRKAAQKRRMVVMGLCTVGGGLIIGLSAGLLAPVIGAGLAAGFTSIGVAGTSSFFAGAGAATLIGTTGAGIGARIGINASDRRTGAVKTFEYRPLHNNKRVNLIITVSGWMTGKVDDVRLPFSTVDPVMGDIYSVLWEPEMLQTTGQTIQILATEALTQTIQQILGATALSALMAGLAAPIVLTKLAYLIDNPWTVSLARADAAGLILADSLIDRNLGARPITLVGFSLGARLIFSCLRELAKRGAVGLIQNVYLFGSPIVTRKDEWLRARTVVAGRFVNGFAGHDWILGYLFRATSGGIRSIAGLSKVPVPGVENIDLSESVPGHMAYRGLMPVLLSEVGWEVDSYEFSEIEDPDPDNHERRQRELISDIEEARRQLEEKPEKKGFFTRFTRKKAVKKEWETYDEKTLRIDEERDPETVVKENADVLFDVEAIRREALELAKQGEPIENITGHLQVREIKSTLPPMRISSAMLTPPASTESPAIRQTKSHDEPTRSFSFTNGSPHGSSSLRPSMDSTVSVNEKTNGEQVSPSPTASSRPALRSHITAPNIASASDPSLSSARTHRKNPWDEEDADFGKEKDISMSFE